MKSVAEWVYYTDKSLFASLRKSLANRFLEDNAALLGDLNAWMPFFVFLAILLYLSRPQSAVYSIFFGLGTFVLSFQAASILANYFLHPSPWKLEYWLHGIELPAFAQGPEISLPDWPVAAMVGTFHFARLRMKAWQAGNILWLWLPILIFCAIRVYAGYTYPLGTLIAIFVGLVLGWLVFQLARNLELLNPPAPIHEEEEPKDSGSLE